MITRRFVTVEPVFGNPRNNKRLNRFPAQKGARVEEQWKLYCLVHKIGKVQRYAKFDE